MVEFYLIKRALKPSILKKSVKLVDLTIISYDYCTRKIIQILVLIQGFGLLKPAILN